MRILMVGGCHLDSKHLDSGHGLTERLRAHLDGCMPFTLEALSNVDVDHATPVIRHLRKQTPDVLVIQPGGMSCPRDVRNRVRNNPVLRRWKVTSTLTSSLTKPCQLPQYPAHHQLKRDLGWWARDLGKLLMDRFCTLTGRPLADIDRLQRYTLRLVEQAQQLGVRHIVLLTPLPSADSVGRRYRKALTERYRAQSLPNDVQLVVLQDRAEFVKPRTRYMADTRHLNAAGNDAVASAIAERLTNLHHGHMAQLAMAA